VVGTFVKSGWHLFEKWLAPLRKVAGTFVKSGWHLCEEWLAPLRHLCEKWLAPLRKVVGTFVKSGWHLSQAKRVLSPAENPSTELHRSNSLVCKVIAIRRCGANACTAK